MAFSNGIVQWAISLSVLENHAILFGQKFIVFLIVAGPNIFLTSGKTLECFLFVFKLNQERDVIWMASRSI